MKESPINEAFQALPEPINIPNPLYELADELEENKNRNDSTKVHVYKAVEGQVIIQQGSSNTHSFLHPLIWTEGSNSNLNSPRQSLRVEDDLTTAVEDENGQIQYSKSSNNENGNNNNNDFRRESFNSNSRDKGKGRAYSISNSVHSRNHSSHGQPDNEISNPLSDYSTPPATPPKDKSPVLGSVVHVNGTNGFTHSPITSPNLFSTLPPSIESLSKPLPSVYPSSTSLNSPLSASSSSSATINGLFPPSLSTSHGSGARRASTSGITNGMIRSSPRVSSLPRTSSYQHESSSNFNSQDMNKSTGQRFEPVLDEVELSILAQAESIKKERLAKKLELEKVEELKVVNTPKVRRRSTRAGSTGEPTLGAGVLMGNLIGQDHANYVLMYNMLTGIRIGVSRCQAKIKRPLTDEDYSARHKFSFDIVGNELTPSTKYDFKFKDYAPWVFRELREYFYLDPSDYLVSLTAKYILSELGSPGKSGSFFYFSRDYRFIIKTIRHSEHKFLRSILKEYHEHVIKNPHTLLSRFYGLHRVKLPRGRKIHFLIMNNLFPPHRDIHETYDLKGSAIGRITPPSSNPTAILKDLNFLDMNQTLFLGPDKKQLFEEQLRRDTQLLQKLGIMDYSLLTGIHSFSRGNTDNLRDTQLSIFQPEAVHLSRAPTQIKRDRNALVLRNAIERSDPKALDSQNGLPLTDTSERRLFLFYQDEGGIRGTNEQNEDLGVIYYLGIIDILTPYTFIKKFENFFKGFKYDRHMISAVPPVEYGDRFMAFIYSLIKGNDVSLRPRMRVLNESSTSSVPPSVLSMPSTSKPPTSNGISTLPPNKIERAVIEMKEIKQD